MFREHACRSELVRRHRFNAWLFCWNDCAVMSPHIVSGDSTGLMTRTFRPGLMLEGKCATVSGPRCTLSITSFPIIYGLNGASHGAD